MVIVVPVLYYAIGYYATHMQPRLLQVKGLEADALSIINTITGMAIDARSRRPRIATTFGGLSGPAIKPIALRMVWEVARALPEFPVIGIGGIASADDAMEFLVAGASAVQVGTATFYTAEGDPANLGKVDGDFAVKIV